MPRTRNKPAPRPEVPADPALLGLDAAEWAGERVARGGRRDALLGRVEALQLSMDGRTIEARVRGNRPLPYRVSVAREDGHVASRCTCSREAPGPCRHAVAALEALRFPASTGARSGRRAAGRGRIIQPASMIPGIVIIGGAERTRSREERIAVAQAEELHARRQRARRERARVEVLENEAGLPRWSVAPRTRQSAGVVTLRGFDDERFACTCDDFSENELRTCSHIERVKNQRARQRKRERITVPRNLLSVWC